MRHPRGAPARRHRADRQPRGARYTAGRATGGGSCPVTTPSCRWRQGATRVSAASPTASPTSSTSKGAAIR